MAAWAKKYPNTLKAFTTALSQGKQIADTGRAAVEQVLQIPVLTCLACRGHLQIAGPVRALVRERLMVPASPRLTGKIRAMGRIQGTIAPRIFPEAGIFPIPS